MAFSERGSFEDNVPGVKDSRDPAEDAEEDVEEDVGAAAATDDDGHGREDDGEDGEDEAALLGGEKRKVSGSWDGRRWKEMVRRRNDLPRPW